jgi:HPt (histidine-containing phosphotransfer) domain-containing protein
VTDVEAAIGTLRTRFLARSKDDLAELRRWLKCGAEGDDAHHRILHRLAGAAGTFGFHEISAHAKDVEDGLTPGASADGPALRALIAALAKVTTGGGQANAG